MLSIQTFQSIDFNKDYINKSLKELGTIKNSIDAINAMIINIEEFEKNQIENIKKNYREFETYYNSLSLEVEAFINFFKSIRKMNIGIVEKKIQYLEYFEKTYNKYMKFNKTIKNIFEKDYVSEIRKLNQKLERIITDKHELEFRPPKIGSFNDSIVKLDSSGMKIDDNNSSMELLSTNDNISTEWKDFFNFCNEEVNKSGKTISNKSNINNGNNIIIENSNSIESNKKEEDDEIKCSDCRKNKAFKICSHCDQYFC